MKWSLAQSTFASRALKSDGHDYYLNHKTYNLMLIADWQFSKSQILFMDTFFAQMQTNTIISEDLIAVLEVKPQVKLADRKDNLKLRSGNVKKHIELSNSSRPKSSASVLGSHHSLNVSENYSPDINAGYHSNNENTIDVIKNIDKREVTAKLLSQQISYDLAPTISENLVQQHESELDKLEKLETKVLDYLVSLLTCNRGY